MTDIYSV